MHFLSNFTFYAYMSAMVSFSCFSVNTLFLVWPIMPVCPPGAAETELAGRSGGAFFAELGTVFFSVRRVDYFSNSLTRRSILFAF
jgi:hypothetical protein